MVNSISYITINYKKIIQPLKEGYLMVVSIMIGYNKILDSTKYILNNSYSEYIE